MGSLFSCLNEELRSFEVLVVAQGDVLAIGSSRAGEVHGEDADVLGQ